MIEKIISKVRELAFHSPDNVYSVNDEGHCLYNAGTCSDGSIGCIFGQAFKELGLDWGEWGDSNPVNCCSASQVVEHFDGETSDTMLKWCDCIQKEQDVGKSWRASISLADSEYRYWEEKQK